MFKEKIQHLIDAISNSDTQEKNDDLQIVEDTVDKFAAYVEMVVNMESASQIARFRLEGEDFRKYMQDLDQRRKMTHDVCMSGIKMLNALCRMYECDKIFSDEEVNMNRTDAADKIIKATVDEYFEGRQK